jgi:MFS superfamily sulfate permease-like transporter
MIYRFTHGMYYANADLMAREVRGLTRAGTPGLRSFCIDISCVDDIDFTALETLKVLKSALDARDIELLFVHVLDDPAAHSRRQLISAFGAATVFSTIDALLTHVAASPDALPGERPAT